MLSEMLHFFSEVAPAVLAAGGSAVLTNIASGETGHSTPLDTSAGSSVTRYVRAGIGKRSKHDVEKALFRNRAFTRCCEISVCAIKGVSSAAAGVAKREEEMSAHPTNPVKLQVLELQAV